MNHFIKQLIFIVINIFLSNIGSVVSYVYLPYLIREFSEKVYFVMNNIE